MEDDLYAFSIIITLLCLAGMAAAIFWGVSRAHTANSMREASKKVADNKLSGRDTHINTIIDTATSGGFAYLFFTRKLP